MEGVWRVCVLSGAVYMCLLCFCVSQIISTKQKGAYQDPGDLHAPMISK